MNFKEKTVFKCLLSTVLAVFATVMVAFAAQELVKTPASSIIPSDMKGYSASMPSTLSSGDIVFPAAYPSFSELTGTEKFMVAGGKSTEGVSCEAWYREVLKILRAYYSIHKAIPETLDPSVIAECARISESEAEGYVLYKNPITGAWPKLKASSSSPGDIYCRPLTRQEAEHVSGPGGDGTLNLLLEGQALDDNGKKVPARMLGDAWYVRVYGENGRVIITAIDKWWMKL